MLEKLNQMKLDWQQKFPNRDFPESLEAFIKTEPAWSKLVGGRLLNSQSDHPLLSHDYINERDRKNSDIMANVEAMIETTEHFFFVSEFKRGVLGYWQCPLRGWLSLWHLDTEGQYQIAAGKNFPETYLNEALLNNNDVTSEYLLEAFGEVGLSLERSEEKDIYANMDKAKRRAAVNPTAFRHVVYLQRKKNQKPPEEPKAPEKSKDTPKKRALFWRKG